MSLKLNKCIYIFGAAPFEEGSFQNGNKTILFMFLKDFMSPNSALPYV